MEIPLLDKAIELLSNRNSIVLVTLTRQEGSTPRASGSRMIVAESRETFGTIGGGILEAEAIAQGLLVLETRAGRIVSLHLTPDDQKSIDMVCGGNVDILLEYIAADSEQTRLFQTLRGRLQAGNPGWYLTLIEGSDPSHLVTHRHVLTSAKDWSEPQRIGRDRLESILRQCKVKKKLCRFEAQSTQLLVAPILAPCNILLFGAGHVSQPTSQLARNVDFAVTVIDDRAEYANRKRFPAADRILVVNEFSDACAKLKIDSETFIVIMTRGHAYDESVLRQVIDTPSAYIGMIGSRKKARHIYDRLLADGIGANAFQRVHCPVGLKIDAETPAEISVSIVAELIQKRHALLSGGV